MSAGDRRALRQRVGAALEERIAPLAPARRQRFALARARLERYAGDRRLRVLDAGCGDGLLALALAERHPDWQLVGVDNRQELLDYARRRAATRRVENLSFERAELTEPLGRERFDAALAIECLAEIPDDARAVEVLAASLAPGGLLLLQVPDRDWRPVLPGSPARWRDEVRHGYSPQEVINLLRAAGLAAIELSHSFRGTVAVAQELRDRLKASHLALQAAVFPAMCAAVALERRGVTWGPPRALLATGRRL